MKDKIEKIDLYYSTVINDENNDEVLGEVINKVNEIIDFINKESK